MTFIWVQKVVIMSSSPGADPASKLRGAISVLFRSQVSSRVYSVR